MVYIAARGGEEAIKQAERLYHALKGPLDKAHVDAIERDLPYLLDRVMGEASLYAPQLAALAIAQTGGDLSEAVLLLRAYRSTQPRLAYAETITPDNMIAARRISASFKDIPGGQMLGPTLDYSHRLLRIDVLDGVAEDAPEEGFVPATDPAAKNYPFVADWQREQNLMSPLEPEEPVNPADIPDLTRDPLLVPVPREQRLQALARAETGGVLALGYAAMRGYGGIHPTVNELRLAYAEVELKHPVTGAVFSAGRIRLSQAEVVTTFGGTKERPELELGFAATLGWNEIKVIAGSMLDMAMEQEDPHPAHTQDFVLYHTEGVESSGFCIHFKLPHYVTFGSSLESFRKVLQALGWYKEPPKQKRRDEDAEDSRS